MPLLPNISNWKRRKKRHILRYMLGAAACGISMGLGISILFQVDADPTNKLLILFWTALIDAILVSIMYEDLREVLRLDLAIDIETRETEGLVID